MTGKLATLRKRTLKIISQQVLQVLGRNMKLKNQHFTRYK